MKQIAKSHLPLPLTFRIVVAILITLWGASLVFAAATSHPLASADGFKWIYFNGAAFDYYDYIGRMYYLHTSEFFNHPGYAWYYPAAGVFPLQAFYALGKLAGTWMAGYLAYIAVAAGGSLFAAFKLYPALCFALFLQPRRSKEMLLGLLTLGAVTLAALRYIHPSIAIAFTGVRSGMAKWMNDYAMTYGPASATYDHSLYEVIKVLTRDLYPVYAVFMRDYLIVAGAFALLVFFTRVIHLPRSNQLTFLVACSVFLPPASFDYTLQNLYVPFAWLVLSFLHTRAGTPARRAIGSALILLALIFAPETFLMWNNMTAAGLFKGFILLLLVTLSARVPFGDLSAIAADQQVAETEPTALLATSSPA